MTSRSHARGARLARLAAGVVLATVVGCDACGQAAVATLSSADGAVSRDEAAEPLSWADAPLGTVFGLGDAVRTGDGAHAQLGLAAGGILDLGPATIVRFSTSPGAGGAGAALEVGEAEIEGGEIVLDTIIGQARLERGTRVRIARGDTSTLSVLVGRATIETAAERVDLAAGQGLVVDVGGAIIERTGRPEGAADAGPARAETPDAGSAAVPDAVDAGALAPDAVAIAVHGRVRVRGEGQTRWTALGEGESLTRGSRVAVPRGATLEVRTANGTAVVRGAAEVVVGAGGSLVDASSGRLEVRTDTGEITVHVPGGVIVARAEGGPGEARVDVGADGSRVEAVRGAVDVRGEDGDRTLRAGEHATLGEEGALAEVDRVPDRPDVAIDAGESPYLHDPETPTAVRIRVGSACAGDAIVEVARGSSFRGAPAYRGSGSVVVVAPSGSSRYRVRCATADGVETEVRATGSLRVSRDAGSQPLPRGAPASVVDADGRPYTVLYQNQLPAITVRWPRAPRGPYVLEVRASGGARVEERSASPSVSLASGRLAEGTHRIADGSARTPETTLRIEYDNAAPAAYLRPSMVEGGAMSIEGAAFEGATVAIGGAPVELDAQRRFRASATIPGDETCVAVRISHPQRGVHYYLRCP
jgi:hypothetical protein